MSDLQQVFTGDHAWRDDANGSPMRGQTISLWVEEGELKRLLEAYDPSSGAPPSAADAQVFLQIILDSILADQNGA